MAYDFQVVVDAADPHAQADWWAETLGWEVEPSDPDFIRRMIAEGYATDSDTTTHRGRLVWKEGAAINAPGGRASGRPRVLFQLVPEAKAGKNRLHLDVRVGEDQAEAGTGPADQPGCHRPAPGPAGPAHLDHPGRSGGQRVLRDVISSSVWSAQQRYRQDRFAHCVTIPALPAARRRSSRRQPLPASGRARPA
jgi:Glyoxalase-like domain